MLYIKDNELKKTSMEEQTEFPSYDVFWGASDIARKFSFTHVYITMLCSRGQIPGAVKSGHKWRVPGDVVKVMVERGSLITPAQTSRGITEIDVPDDKLRLVIDEEPQDPPGVEEDRSVVRQLLGI